MILFNDSPERDLWEAALCEAGHRPVRYPDTDGEGGWRGRLRMIHDTVYRVECEACGQTWPWTDYTKVPHFEPCTGEPS